MEVHTSGSVCAGVSFKPSRYGIDKTRLPTFRMFSVVSSSFNDVNCSVRVSACVCAGCPSNLPSMVLRRMSSGWYFCIIFYIFQDQLCPLRKECCYVLVVYIYGKPHEKSVMKLHCGVK